MPYVYLIQPVELVGTNRYKVGMSRLNNLSRLRSYKMGTRYISMFDCEDHRFVERTLIAAFNKRFNRVGGNEYFEVPEESTAVQLFVSIVMNNRVAPKPPEVVSEVIANERDPPDWIKAFAYSRQQKK